MINEKRLKKELQKRFDAFVRKCGMADDMKSYGYASCYDDVSDIIEQLAAKNDIEQQFIQELGIPERTWI